MSGTSSYLPALDCPYCGREMETRPIPVSGTPTATQYSNCLRRCPACRVAYSNTRTAEPTLIHEDPIANVPMHVRAGTVEVLGNALNVRNRPIKLRKFGFSTSEDAVTWAVFSFLHEYHRDALPELYQRIFNISSAQPPTLLIWGVPVPDGGRGNDVRNDLAKVCDRLGERANSRSEPDILLDFGNDGLVIAEIKYRSGNDKKLKANWTPYLSQSDAFGDPQRAKESQLYELVRNWRIGRELAQTRPFVLANLALSKKLASDSRLTDFERSLATSGTSRFLRLTWSDFLSASEQAIGKFPQWMDDYLRSRELR